MSIESQQTQEYDNIILNNVELNENQETQHLDVSESIDFLNCLDNLFNNNLSNNDDINNNNNEDKSYENTNDNDDDDDDDDDDDESDISIQNNENQNIIENNNKRKRKNICPGCGPVFQPNQLAHIGPNGCLGDY